MISRRSAMEKIWRKDPVQVRRSFSEALHMKDFKTVSLFLCEKYIDINDGAMIAVDLCDVYSLKHLLDNGAELNINFLKDKALNYQRVVWEFEKIKEEDQKEMSEFLKDRFDIVIHPSLDIKVRCESEIKQWKTNMIKIGGEKMIITSPISGSMKIWQSYEEHPSSLLIDSINRKDFATAHSLIRKGYVDINEEAMNAVNFCDVNVLKFLLDNGAELDLDYLKKKAPNQQRALWEFIKNKWECLKIKEEDLDEMAEFLKDKFGIVIKPSPEIEVRCESDPKNWRKFEVKIDVKQPRENN